MKRGFLLCSLWMTFVCPGAVLAQRKTPEPVNLAHLEIFAELAATTQEGRPAVLRITLKNTGNLAVDLPMPGIGCSGEDGSLSVEMVWTSNDPEDGSSQGWGCGGSMTDRPSLMERAQNEWIRLQPGEFVTVSDNIRSKVNNMKPGTVEYWAEYRPPRLTAKELAELQASGLVVPKEKLETPHEIFVVL